MFTIAMRVPLEIEEDLDGLSPEDIPMMLRNQNGGGRLLRNIFSETLPTGVVIHGATLLSKRVVLLTVSNEDDNNA